MPRRVSLAVWSGCLLLLVTSSGIPLSGQRGRPGGPPGPGGPGRDQPRSVVLGQVVDGDTGDPISGAIIQLTGAPPAPVTTSAGPTTLVGRGAGPQFVISDANGRFVIRDVRPGDYPLSARQPGYLLAQYGQRRPTGPSDRLTVNANEPVTEATIRMWRYAAINGVVRDEAGEPAVRVTVRTLRRIFRAGRERLEPFLGAETDDRGVFRIANMTPGEYYVFVPSVTSSTATSTASWYVDARTAAGSSAEVLRPFRESGAPTPAATGLRVGDQIVALSTVRGSTAPSVNADGRLEVYRTVFHPSALTLERASTITLGSGEERDGVDIQMVLEPAFTVTGQVHGTDGPAVHIGVRLLSADADRFTTQSGLETSETSTDEQGRFTLLGVPPGAYSLEVLRIPRAPLNTRMTTVISTGGGGLIMSSTGSASLPEEVPDAPTLWAQQTLSVGNADVHDVALQLREGARVSGRVDFEGQPGDTAADTLERLSINLTPASGERLAVTTSRVAAAPDGTFSTTGFPPGEYFMTVAVPAVPGGVRWTPKSAMAGGRDVLSQPLQISGEDVTGIVITLTDRITELNGNVQLPPDFEDDALVVVFPADYQQWIADGMSARRARTLRTGTRGQFRMTGLPAGSYLAVAVPAGTEVDLQDPGGVAALARLASSIQVPDAGAASVALTLAQVR